VVSTSMSSRPAFCTRCGIRCGWKNCVDMVSTVSYLDLCALVFSSTHDTTRHSQTCEMQTGTVENTKRGDSGGEGTDVDVDKERICFHIVNGEQHLVLRVADEREVPLSHLCTPMTVQFIRVACVVSCRVASRAP
jgi:hypothetical protein